MDDSFSKTRKGSVATVVVIVGLVLLANSATALMTAVSVRRLQEELRWAILVTAQAGIHPASDRPVRGAPVGGRLLVEFFSDYACSYCVAMAPALDSVRAHFGDGVEWRYKHLPRRPSEGGASMHAARLGSCVQEVGGPWEMLRSVHRFGVASDTDLARFVSSNAWADAVVACAAHPDIETLIWSDILDASRRGIAGTPTLESRGVRLTGQLTLSQLIEFVEHQLEKSNAR